MKEQNGKLSRDEFISFVKAVLKKNHWKKTSHFILSTEYLEIASLQNLQEDLMRLRQMDFSDIKSL